jgi:hypothetical protein
MKKVTPFKEREPMSQYEIHSLVIGYSMLGLTIFLAVTLYLMSLDIKTLIG